LKSDLAAFSVESLQEPLITFENCVFEENYTNPGAGGHGGAILNLAKNIPEGVALESLIMCTNCSFVGNSAMHGSGVEGVTAIDCFFNNDGELGFNYRGIDAALSRLVDCEIRGGNLYKCSIDRSWVNGIAKHGVFSLGCYVTNTLVSGCTIENENVGLIGSYYADQNLSETPSEFVNCTFVGNKANLFMNACYVTSINCAYFDNTNRTGEATSVSFSSSDVNGVSYLKTVRSVLFLQVLKLFTVRITELESILDSVNVKTITSMSRIILRCFHLLCADGGKF
jgi:hypothetical protein